MSTTATPASTTAAPTAAASAQPPEPLSRPPEPLSLKEVLKFPIMRRLFYARWVSVFGDFLALFAVINYLTFKLGANAEPGHQPADRLSAAHRRARHPGRRLRRSLAAQAHPRRVRFPARHSFASPCCSPPALPTSTSSWPASPWSRASSARAQGVVIRSAVPLHGLRSANVLMQQVMFGMRIIGPGLAGLIYKLLGAHACYWADSASFIASGSLIASLALSRGIAPPVPSGVATKLASAAAPRAGKLPHAALLHRLSLHLAGHETGPLLHRPPRGYPLRHPRAFLRRCSSSAVSRRSSPSTYAIRCTSRPVFTRWWLP